MTIEIQLVDGYYSLVLNYLKDKEAFINTVKWLEQGEGAVFVKKLEDLQSCFWDFRYGEANLTLHYNLYLGASIHPTALIDGTTADNTGVRELWGKIVQLHSQPSFLNN